MTNFKTYTCINLNNVLILIMFSLIIIITAVVQIAKRTLRMWEIVVSNPDRFKIWPKMEKVVTVPSPSTRRLEMKVVALL